MWKRKKERESETEYERESESETEWERDSETENERGSEAEGERENFFFERVLFLFILSYYNYTIPPHLPCGDSVRGGENRGGGGHCYGLVRAVKG